jgi:phage-related protein
MDVVSEFRGIPPYKVSFFAHEDGTEPVRRWLGDLTPAVRRYVGFMLNKYVQRYGPDVSATQFGKNLGGGLYEFRLDEEVGADKILYRIFFHVHGDRIVLLLHAYDKGRRSSDRYQSEMIELARQRLRDFYRWREIPHSWKQLANLWIIAHNIGVTGMEHRRGPFADWQRLSGFSGRFLEGGRAGRTGCGSRSRPRGRSR